MTETAYRMSTTVNDVLITHELSRRPARTPDHEAESRALVELAETMADTPKRVLQKLANAALFLCRAGSAGISVSEPGNVFRWRASTPGTSVPPCRGISARAGR